MAQLITYSIIYFLYLISTTLNLIFHFSHPSSSFFFSEKKELFGLVASPFFLFIEKSFHVKI